MGERVQKEGIMGKFTRGGGEDMKEKKPFCHEDCGTDPDKKWISRQEIQEGIIAIFRVNS